MKKIPKMPKMPRNSTTKDIQDKSFDEIAKKVLSKKEYKNLKKEGSRG